MTEWTKEVKLYAFDDVNDLLIALDDNKERYQFFLRRGTETKTIGAIHPYSDLESKKWNLVNSVLAVCELEHGLQIVNTTHDSIISAINHVYFKIRSKEGKKKQFVDWQGNPIDSDEVITEEDEKDSDTLSWKTAKIILKRHNIITFRDIEESFVYDKGIYVPLAEAVIREETTKELEERASRYMLNEVTDKVKRLSRRMNRSDLEEYKLKICVKNGYIDLTTNELEFKKHTPEEIFFNKLPVKYDENATCPAIQKFLKEVFLPADIPAIEEWTGYNLLRDYPIHKAMLLYGEGRNGKTTFIKLLNAFLGNESVADEDLYDIAKDRFSIAQLYHKLANFSDDLSPRSIKHTGTFKKLVGQSPVSAQYKYGNKFKFVNYAKIICCCNQLFKVSDKTTAFYDRWLLIRCLQRFVGKDADKNLINKLTTPEELSGFLNLALKGLRRLLKNGYFSYDLTLEQVRDLMLSLSDTVEAFMQDCLEINAKAPAIPKDELYNKYVSFCADNKLSPTAKTWFGMKLNKRFGEAISTIRSRINGERIYCWKGIEYTDGFDTSNERNNKTETKETPEAKLEDFNKRDDVKIDESLLKGLLKEIWEFVGDDGCIKRTLMNYLRQNGYNANAINRIINDMLERGFLAYNKEENYIRKAKTKLPEGGT